MMNKITTALKRNAQFRQTRRELESLTNRELADIGISRFDIEAIARRQAATLY